MRRYCYSDSRLKYWRLCKCNFVSLGLEKSLNRQWMGIYRMGIWSCTLCRDSRARMCRQYKAALRAFSERKDKNKANGWSWQTPGSPKMSLYFAFHQLSSPQLFFYIWQPTGQRLQNRHRQRKMNWNDFKICKSRLLIYIAPALEDGNDNLHTVRDINEKVSHGAKPRREISSYNVRPWKLWSTLESPKNYKVVPP